MNISNYDHIPIREINLEDINLGKIEIPFDLNLTKSELDIKGIDIHSDNFRAYILGIALSQALSRMEEYKRYYEIYEQKYNSLKNLINEKYKNS